MRLLVPAIVDSATGKWKDCTVTLALPAQDALPAPVLNWHRGKSASWAVCAGVYCYVYEHTYDDDVTNYEVRVCEVLRGDGYLVRVWTYTKERHGTGGSAALREVATTLDEARAWAEIALRYVAIERLTAHARGEHHTWRGWVGVLAQLAGHVTADPVHA